MWVSPAAAAGNARAHENKSHLENCARYGINPETNELATLADCECADYASEPCRGELRPVLWYDPFSEDPKGLFFICEEHDGYYGSPTEGYFVCDDCGKTHAENYTWEVYRVDTDGGTFCMRCFAYQEIHNEENWLDLQDPSVIDKLTFDQVRQAKHLFPVECQDFMGLEFFGNAEFDAMSGESISGGGTEGIKEILREARAAGHTEAMLVLDGAYQFSVSIGCYVREKGGQEEEGV